MFTSLNLIRAGMACAFVAWSMTIGCSKEDERSSETTTVSIGPESSAIKPVLDKGWCAGHWRTSVSPM